MNTEKQIEEMARDLACSIVWTDLYNDEVTVDTRATSEKLRAKGYRKQSEVAREILTEIREAYNKYGGAIGTKLKIEELERRCKLQQ